MPYHTYTSIITFNYDIYIHIHVVAFDCLQQVFGMNMEDTTVTSPYQALPTLEVDRCTFMYLLHMYPFHISLLHVSLSYYMYLFLITFLLHAFLLLLLIKYQQCTTRNYCMFISKLFPSL